MCKSKTVAFLLAIASAVLSSAGAHTHDPNHETSYYLAEHGDFGIGCEDGQLGLHLHLHAGAVVDGNSLDADTEFHPGDLIVVATHQAKALRPAGDAWDFLGTDANEPVWILPQHEKEGVPTFGLATEEIEPGVLVDDVVALSLRYLKGPGDFSLWANDAFGLPTVALSTQCEWLSTAIGVGLHVHYNWGFSRPGTYTAVFEATADLAAGGHTRALAVYTFLVADGPVPLETLEGDVNGDGVVDEIDLLLVDENLGRTVAVWPPLNDI